MYTEIVCELRCIYVHAVVKWCWNPCDCWLENRKVTPKWVILTVFQVHPRQTRKTWIGLDSRLGKRPVYSERFESRNSLKYFTWTRLAAGVWMEKITFWQFGPGQNLNLGCDTIIQSNKTFSSRLFNAVEISGLIAFSENQYYSVG